LTVEKYEAVVQITFLRMSNITILVVRRFS